MFSTVPRPAAIRSRNFDYSFKINIIRKQVETDHTQKHRAVDDKFVDVASKLRLLCAQF